MVDATRIRKVSEEHFPYDSGAFYGSASGLSVGAGLIYEGIRFPEYNNAGQDFDTLEGCVFVLTHECDVAEENHRAFNEHVLVCPIISILDLAENFAEMSSEGAFFGLLPAIASDKVYRVFMLPPGYPSPLLDGGILHLNKITSTHVSEFAQERAKPVCALSDYAQSIFDWKLRNHLLRPKGESLPKLK
jgi:hypothetical protein